MEENNNQLKHYTSVSTLCKILAKGFKFQNGESWDDENDKYTLQKYREYIYPQNVLVLCFCDGAGNVYHWTALGKTDSDNDSDSQIKCSIVLNKDKFLKYVDSIEGMSHHEMKYCRNDEIQGHRIEDLPYLKRNEFSIEKEYRVIYKGGKSEFFLSDIISYIDKIVIGLCTKAEFDEIKQHITTTFHIDEAKITQNLLKGSKEWNDNVDVIAQRAPKRINNINIFN